MLRPIGIEDTQIKKRKKRRSYLPYYATPAFTGLAPIGTSDPSVASTTTPIDEPVFSRPSNTETTTPIDEPRAENGVPHVSIGGIEWTNYPATPLNPQERVSRRDFDLARADVARFLNVESMAYPSGHKHLVGSDEHDEYVDWILSLEPDKVPPLGRLPPNVELRKSGTDARAMWRDRIAEMVLRNVGKEHWLDKREKQITQGLTHYLTERGVHIDNPRIMETYARYNEPEYDPNPIDLTGPRMLPPVRH